MIEEVSIVIERMARRLSRYIRTGSLRSRTVTLLILMKTVMIRPWH